MNILIKGEATHVKGHWVYGNSLYLSIFFSKPKIPKKKKNKVFFKKRIHEHSEMIYFTSLSLGLFVMHLFQWIDNWNNVCCLFINSVSNLKETSCLKWFSFCLELNLSLGQVPQGFFLVLVVFFFIRIYLSQIDNMLVRKISNAPGFSF